MNAHGFKTPEEAMMVGFPPRYCRVLASAIDGDVAYVVLETGSDDYPYPYGGWCHRHDGGWVEGGSSNMGGGWEGVKGENGNLATSGSAPPGAEAVRLELNGARMEVPVQNGMYVAVFRDVPCPDDDWPRMVSVKINGAWE